MRTESWILLLTLNLASIALAVAGFAAFAGLYAAGHDWSGSFRLGSLDLVVFTAAVAVLLVVHEGVHGAVVALFGVSVIFADRWQVSAHQAVGCMPVSDVASGRQTRAQRATRSCGRW